MGGHALPTHQARSRQCCISWPIHPLTAVCEVWRYASRENLACHLAARAFLLAFLPCCTRFVLPSIAAVAAETAAAAEAAALSDRRWAAPKGHSSMATSCTQHLPPLHHHSSPHPHNFRLATCEQAVATRCHLPPLGLHAGWSLPPCVGCSPSPTFYQRLLSPTSSHSLVAHQTELWWLRGCLLGLAALGCSKRYMQRPPDGQLSVQRSARSCGCGRLYRCVVFALRQCA